MLNAVHFCDCREGLRAMASAGIKARTCVTSPPYYKLRNYGHDAQIGQEESPEQFINELVEVFRGVRNVLEEDGTLWLNIADSYGAGKQLLMIPARVALALQADGWVLRQDLVWSKPNPMPESVRDRCTKAHEYLFLLAKSPSYYYDAEAVMEPVAESTVARLGQATLAQQVGSARVPGKTNGNMKAVGRGDVRNRRSVWSITTKPYKGAHFATFPPALVEPCILAGSRTGDVVLYPFIGSGTTAAVALQLGRQFIGFELNPDYKPLQDQRIAAVRDMVAAPYPQQQLFEDAA